MAKTAKRPPVPLNVMELEQIKVLRASGLSFHAISKRLGRDHKTVKKACSNSQVAVQIEAIKEDLAASFEDLAKRMIASIADADIRGINAYQRTVASAVAVDKMRLLRDQSTQNVALHSIVEAIERKRRERLPRAAQGEVQRITAEAERMKGGE